MSIDTEGVYADDIYDEPSPPINPNTLIALHQLRNYTDDAKSVPRNILDDRQRSFSGAMQDHLNDLRRSAAAQSAQLLVAEFLVVVDRDQHLRLGFGAGDDGVKTVPSAAVTGSSVGSGAGRLRYQKPPPAITASTISAARMYFRER